jgi:predicted RND superfamily exporter protein
MHEPAAPRAVAALADHLDRHPRFWIGLLVALSLLLGSGMLRLKIDNSVEALLSQDTPTSEAFRVFGELFGNSELAVIAFRDDGGILQPAVLAELDTLTARIAADVPHVAGVHSLVNLPTVVAVDGALTVQPLLDDAARTEIAAGNTEAVAARLLAEPLVRRSLLSDDTRTTSLVVQVAHRPGDSVYRRELTLGLRAVLAEAGSGRDYVMGGPPVFLTEFDEAIVRDLLVFTPLVLLILTFLLWSTFRSMIGVILPLGAVSIGGLWAMGLMGWLGYPVTLATTIIPPLLLVTGIEDAIFILSFYEHEARRTTDRRRRAKRTMMVTLVACTLTSVTTAVGFGTLAITEIQAVFETGVIAGLGSMFIWAANNLMLPLALRVVSFTPRPVAADPRTGGFLARLLDRLATLALRWPKAIVVASLAVLVAALPGLGMLKVETNLIKYFDPESAIVRAHGFLEHNLSGVAPLEVLVDGRAAGGVTAPAVVAAMADLRELVAAEPIVDWSMGTADALGMLARSLGDGATAASRVPTSTAEIEQLLLLYEMSGGGAGLEAYMSEDRQWGRVSARLKDVGTIELEETLGRIRAAFPSDGPVRMSFADNTSMFVEVVDAMLLNTAQSFGLATLAIWLLMSIVLRSPKMGLVFMFPNILPVLVVIGCMGYLGIDVNLSTMMIGSIAVGIAVDNTIHVFAHFPEALKAAGGRTEVAVRDVMQTVGRASLSAAAAITGGFLVLTQSGFYPNFAFGTLSALTVVVAVICDLTLAYALWTLIGRRRERAAAAKA